MTDDNIKNEIYEDVSINVATQQLDTLLQQDVINNLDNKIAVQNQTINSMSSEIQELKNLVNQLISVNSLRTT